mmetsp:Transcript_63656/g.149196  ORF Transcript_63656/g.149196 Transcript_63656/m.149196 type:complete len:282 (+) Transcript_63656:182-1027(+)
MSLRGFIHRLCVGLLCLGCGGRRANLAAISSWALPSDQRSFDDALKSFTKPLRFKRHGVRRHRLKSTCGRRTRQATENQTRLRLGSPFRICMEHIRCFFHLGLDRLQESPSIVVAGNRQGVLLDIRTSHGQLAASYFQAQALCLRTCSGQIKHFLAFHSFPNCVHVLLNSGAWRSIADLLQRAPKHVGLAVQMLDGPSLCTGLSFVLHSPNGLFLRDGEQKLLELQRLFAMFHLLHSQSADHRAQGVNDQTHAVSHEPEPSCNVSLNQRFSTKGLMHDSRG